MTVLMATMTPCLVHYFAMFVAIALQVFPERMASAAFLWCECEDFDDSFAWP